MRLAKHTWRAPERIQAAQSAFSSYDNNNNSLAQHYVMFEVKYVISHDQYICVIATRTVLYSVCSKFR